jgi:cytochrome oxidase Cu insertion factor (SCO1/SenC/PrrC family)
MVVVVSFVFTTCNGTCPATTQRLAEAARLLDRAGVGPDRARFVSIALDPARDTPEALRRYMRLYDVDPARWSFLTGPPAQVEKVHAAWGMWTRQTPNGLDHPSRVFLVDRKGRVREIYNLDFLRPAWLAEDVRLLLGEGR